MGDRANVRFVERKGNEIYFYTHWDGYRLPEILASALYRGRGRWDDESYLARIIFSEMIKNDVLNETGYGISTYQTDHNYPDLVVNVEFQFVIDREDNMFSFDDFINEYKAS